MLTHEQICNSIKSIVKDYPIKSISYFGSYANGNATEESDLDILVEFEDQAVSLLTLADLKYRLEDALGVDIDIIHISVPKDSILDIGKVVSIYAA